MKTAIDTYISTFPLDTQKKLQQLREVMVSSIPEATEKIAYGIPTIQLKGKNVVHFAGYNNHIGFYPTPAILTKFKKELSPFKSSKGAVQFPLNQPIPFKLVQKMMAFRLEQMKL